MSDNEIQEGVPEGTEPRRAQLLVAWSTSASPYSTPQGQYVHLKASNGERLMHGEVLDDGERGREAIIRAMVEVLEAEGYTVLKVPRGSSVITASSGGTVWIGPDGKEVPVTTTTATAKPEPSPGEIKSAVEDWFSNVDLDDLYRTKGWSV